MSVYNLFSHICFTRSVALSVNGFRFISPEISNEQIVDEAEVDASADIGEDNDGDFIEPGNIITEEELREMEKLKKAFGVD